jgi:hypothetical protein
MANKVARIALRLSRCIYGLFILVDGGLRVVGSMQGQYLGFVQPSADAFNRALWDTHFMNPLLGVSFVVAGLALFSNRTAPLGVALILPTMIIIFFFHVFLTGEVIWGTCHLLFTLFLLWVYRDAFKPLWNFRADAR